MVMTDTGQDSGARRARARRAYHQTFACLLASKAGEVGGGLLDMPQAVLEVVTEVDCTACLAFFLHHQHNVVDHLTM